jgi:hypothetical protein
LKAGISLKEEVKTRWRWGVVATLSMMLLSLYPHLQFRISRGTQWNGSYAAIEGVGDEVAYSAYINALMAGRPRRNDPYSGRDDEGKRQQPESLFSIQFVPAYVIAFSARALGISASTAFIALTPLAAGATSLALFWLLVLMTRDEALAAAGTVGVLCLGTVAGGHGLLPGLFGGEPLYNYLMFLRRYQPAASFPLFPLFCSVVWWTLHLRNRKAVAATTTASGIIFGLLVFSYVYLWTAAIAWLACLALLWLVARPPNWQQNLKSLGIVVTVCLATLVPFAALYARRAMSMDAVQALEKTHRLDLFRLPEVISIATLLLVAWLVRRRVIVARDPKTLFAMSFALLPILVFNQQVISGISMQPLHYEMFVANYSALISLILVLAPLVKRPVAPAFKMRRKALLWIAIAAFQWGAYETAIATKRSMEFDRQLDEARPVALRLEKLARQDEMLSGGNTRATVLSSDLLAADGLPTAAPQAVLWAPHMLVFSGVTATESKERFHQYLYYTGITPERLEQILRTEHQYGFAVGMFGFERTIKGLSINPSPITSSELKKELNQYGEYCASFTHERAQQTQLSYLIVPEDDEPDLANLDRWYERDSGERVGNYTLYRIRLRDDNSTMNAVTSISSGLR